MALKNLKFLKYVIVVSVLVFLIPKPALAFIGTGLFDFFEAATVGLAPVVGPVARQLIVVFFIYLFSLVSALISSSLLQLAINPAWLSLKVPIVTAGWNFTAGIANMFIILILIVIAFAFIFKLETFQLKKTLFRLIVVALFINFSLLFVSALVDIFNILFNTLYIQPGNSTLPTEVIGHLLTGSWAMILSIAAWFGLLLGLFLIPFTAPFAHYALLLGSIVAPVLFLPNILAWIFQIISLFLVSLIFLIYTILFAARIFIIQLLAILSPLVFLAWILPQTRKYCTQWFSKLLEWLMLGFVLFFFLVLGLRVANTLMPPSQTLNIPGFAWFNLKSYFLYYFFLIIYLVVALILAKKTMPAAGQAIIGGVSGFAAGLWGRAIKPIGKALGPNFQKWAVAQEKKEEERKARRAAGEKVTISPAEKITGGAVKWVRVAVETTTGTSMKASLAKGVSNKAEDYKKRFGEDYKGAAKYSRLVKNELEKTAIARYLADAGGKAFKELSDLETRKLMDVARKWDPTTAKTLQKVNPHLITDKDITEEDKAEGITTQGQKIADVVTKMKGEDYKNLSKTALKNVHVVDAMIANAMGGHIQQLIEGQGKEAAETLEREIWDRAGKENKSADVYLKEKNLRLHKYITSGAGRGLIDLGKKPEPEKIIPGTEKEFKETPRTISEELRERKKEK